MFLKSSVFLVFLSSLVLFLNQVKSPKVEERDPCADEETVSKKRGGMLRIFHHYGRKDPPPLTDEELKNLANQLFHEGKLEEALRCYSKAIKVNPLEPKHYRNRGFCYARMGKLELAVEDYLQSVKLDPYNVRSQFFAGRQLFEMDRFEECLPYLERALQYGVERNMANEEKNMILSILEQVRPKVREIEKEREKERVRLSLDYFKSLINQDADRKIAKIEESGTGDSDDAITRIKSARDDYLNKLMKAFFVAEEGNESESSGELPQYLCDVINMEIMTDPVITPDGITYERSQISKHLETRRTDPVSRGSLEPEQLRPNNALKELIDDFLKKNK